MSITPAQVKSIKGTGEVLFCDPPLPVMRITLLDGRVKETGLNEETIYAIVRELPGHKDLLKKYSPYYNPNCKSATEYLTKIFST